MYAEKEIRKAIPLTITKTILLNKPNQRNEIILQWEVQNLEKTRERNWRRHKKEKKKPSTLRLMALI